MNLDPQNHWLTALLSPRSVALVGASLRPGSIGNNMYKLLADSAYQGTIYLINPHHHSLFEQRCFESIVAVPETPDCVVFAISGTALEQAFNEAIAKGVGAIVIFANTGPGC